MKKSMRRKVPTPTSPRSAVGASVTSKPCAPPSLRPRSLREIIKWGHLVYFANGPVLLIRAEDKRVLFGFWRGQRLRDIEPRLKPGGKYEMATLELVEETPLERETVVELVREAVALNAAHGDPTDLKG